MLRTGRKMTLHPSKGCCQGTKVPSCERSEISDLSGWAFLVRNQLIGAHMPIQTKNVKQICDASGEEWRALEVSVQS